MRTLVFQHSVEEGPGSLEYWLNRRRFPFHVHHWYRDAQAPHPDPYEFLVILGGPMNVDQESTHPWLRPEKEFIRQWLALERPTLGICLGGQLLAQCLGGKVTKAQQPEIGSSRIQRTAAYHPAFRRWPHELEVAQWHEDEFSLPEGAISLARSKDCENQAFSFGQKVLGLQFHPEATEAWMRGNIESEAEEKGLAARNINWGLFPPMTDCFFSLLEDYCESARTLPLPK
jgi:GMP synthase-like glutamine amidotransferase